MIGVVIMTEEVQIQVAQAQANDSHKISDWLRESGFEIIEENKDSIILDALLGTRLVIEQDSERKPRHFIKYYCIFRFKDDPNNEENNLKKLELINRLNTNVIFSRFSMPKPEIIVSDYFIVDTSFDKIKKEDLIKNLTFFELVTINAIRQYDEDDLIQ